MIYLESTKTDTSQLDILFNQLEPYLDFQLVAANTRYVLKDVDKHLGQCYLMKSGAMSMYRQPGDILVEFFDAPTLRGVNPYALGTNITFVLKVITSSEIAVLERHVFFELLGKYNLWENFARHQMAINRMVIEKMINLTAPTAYTVIRHQLYELINTSIYIRESITAVEYIRNKTRLSRSRIMYILSELKRDGYIVIENGMLISVHMLPEEL